MAQFETAEEAMAATSGKPNCGGCRRVGGRSGAWVYLPTGIDLRLLDGVDFQRACLRTSGWQSGSVPRLNLPRPNLLHTE
jgi:hypothetical protein